MDQRHASDKSPPAAKTEPHEPVPPAEQETAPAQPRDAGGETTEAWSGSGRPAAPLGDAPEIPDHRMLKRLGRGGMGLVFQARHTVLDRLVAIKLPLAGGWADEEDRERFLREARATAKLRHPNICPVYEVGQAGQRPYISMAYIEGRTLAQWTSDRRPNAREAAEMVARLARAVAYAHEHGVVHRDIKPGNVMVDAETGEPVLMDFGLAKEITRQGSQLTQEGQVMGTPAFMAPEQAAGRHEQIGTSSDVYALGAVLYYLLCGRAPFEGTSGEVLRRVQTDEPATPRKVAPQTHRDLETICLKAMAREPADRYATAAELAGDLERFCAGESILARREAMVRKAWRRVSRRPLTAALVVLLVAAVAAFAYFTTRGRQIARLQDEIEDAFQADPRTEEDLHAAEVLIGRLDSLDHGRAAEDRQALYEQVAAAIRRAMKEPRLTAEEFARLEGQADLLATRDSQLADALRKELRKRRLDWQPLFDLGPPFEEVASVFNGSAVRVDDGALLSTGDVAATPFRCPVRARLEAEFDETWTTADRLSLVLGADGSGTEGSGGYAFTVEPPAGPPSAADEPPEVSAAVKILRGDVLLRETEVRLARGPLHLSAARDFDRLIFQVNATAPVEFLDAFPVPEGEDRVLALRWPEGVRLGRVRASVQPLAPAASPLEQGDALFARSRFADALAEYQKQAIASSDTEFGQEARVKQALCLEAMGQVPTAVELFERVAAEPGQRWPLVAGCRLWAIKLKQGKLDEAYAIFDLLGTRYTAEEVRPLVPADLVATITAQYHERSQGVYLFVYNPNEIRDLERTRAVLEFFGQKGVAYDSTRYYLCRAYHMEGKLDEALEAAESLVADNPRFDKGRYRWFQTHEMHAWLLRLDGNPRGALAALDRQLLDASGEYREEGLPLLVERARVHAALGQWDAAAKDLDDLLERMPLGKLQYHHYAGACLLRGFLLERQGDREGALAAWEGGLPTVHPRYGWDEIRTIEGFGHAMLLAALTKQFTADEVDVLIDRAVRRMSSVINPAIIKSTLRIVLMDLTPKQIASLVCQAPDRPRTREVARQIAFRERPIDELIRSVLAVAVMEGTDQLLIDGPLSPEQEELCTELAREAYAVYFSGRLSKGQLMQLMFTWRGMTDTFGWGGLAPSLDPPLRGPLAYLLGLRLLKLGSADGAAKLFRTATEDAPADSVLQELSDAELAKLPEASAGTQEPSPGPPPE